MCSMADEAVHIGGSAGARLLSLDRQDRRRLQSHRRRGGASRLRLPLARTPPSPRRSKTNGIIFVGPPVKAIEAMGDKITSKKLAAAAGVSTVPGHMGLIADADEAVTIAKPDRLPGDDQGLGRRRRQGHAHRLERRRGARGLRALASPRPRSSFGDDRIFIEKFVTEPRHIEIQLIGDQHGNVLYLNERECSIQRRNQKVIEEAPSPVPRRGDAQGHGRAGRRARPRPSATSRAGTVEFIVDGERNFYFLEMNTRLQVEHPVTELITGLDLVELMLRVAAGEKLPLTQDDVQLNGWAIESRLYAEDPYRNFLPSTGRLTRYRPPAEKRDAEHARAQRHRRLSKAARSRPSTIR